MKCPMCKENTPDAWAPVAAFYSEGRGGYRSEVIMRRAEETSETYYTSHWMECANPRCAQIVLEIKEQTKEDGGGERVLKDTWLAIPRHGNAQLPSQAVPADLARDYHEACLLLDLSPRMSAVLSRRVVREVLKREGQYGDGRKQLDDFVADDKRPSELRNNVKHLQEMGNFGAHAVVDEETGEVLDVSRDEAEWTLQVVDGLFDYFYVGPARDAQRRAEFDEKMKRAGRNPIG